MPERILSAHKTPGTLNDSIDVFVEDERGPGGASSLYSILVYADNPVKGTGHGNIEAEATLQFQQGSPREEGNNGITNESLMVVLLDRFEGYQQGPFKCDVNAAIHDLLQTALELMKGRTASRIERGVEGSPVR